MKNVIFVSHNPITRLQLDLLCASYEVEDIIHIETRGPSSRKRIENALKRVITIELPCNTYYTHEQIAHCIDQLNEATNLNKRYTLILPHLYNHLFAILSELRCVKSVYYLEEGNLSLGLVKKVDMRQYSYKDLVRFKTPHNLVKDIRLLTDEIFDDGANERITMMPYFENQPFPKHPKYAGTISISKKAFIGYTNRVILKKPIYNQEVESVFGEYAIIYLPNLYCKIPSWIDFADKEVLTEIISKTKLLIDEYKLEKIVLKPHSSTPKYM